MCHISYTIFIYLRFSEICDSSDPDSLFLSQGELTFTESQDGQLKVGGPVKHCVSALGVTEDALRTAMSGRVLSAGGELVSKEHSLSDANYTRLALAKAAYDRLFTWIVQQVRNRWR